MSNQPLSNTLSSLPEWVIKDDQLFFNNNNSLVPVPAREVVRIEFKGQKEFAGAVINKKPSGCITDIKFNRFPGKLKLELLMPSNNLIKPSVNIMIMVVSSNLTLEEIPKSDQIVFGNHWVPLVKEEMTEIAELLHECAIDKLGTISLKGALNLLRSNSELLNINKYTDTPIEDASIVDHNNIGDKLKNVGFKETLYQYQIEGVSWLKSIADEGLGCVLADEMGLGKTAQVIALLAIFKSEWGFPSLIVAPATLLENWKREINKFSSNLSALIHAGSMRTGFPSQLNKYDIIVTSYDIAVRDQGMIGMLNWGFIILDEAQAIKNPDTRRAVAVKSLSRKASIAVSGTVLENKLLDIWSIMDFACPRLLGTQSQFENNYDDNETSASIIEGIVSPLILRRRVIDVASELPDKIIIPQAVTMSEEEIYMYEDLRRNISIEYGSSATLVSLLKLRQYCTHPSILDQDCHTPSLMACGKYDRLLEILDEIVIKKQKAIIFTSFTAMVDLLASDLQRIFGIPCKQIDGRTPVAIRQDTVDIFSAYIGAAILILNPRAAGTGLNITAANHVIHYNLEWNPAIEDQATARAYRRGQRLPVTVHRLFYPNTIDEVIDARISRKRILASAAVVGTASSEADTADILRALTISPVRLNDDIGV